MYPRDTFQIINCQKSDTLTFCVRPILNYVVHFLILALHGLWTLARLHLVRPHQFLVQAAANIPPVVVLLAVHCVHDLLDILVVKDKHFKLLLYQQPERSDDQIICTDLFHMSYLNQFGFRE